MAMGNVEGNVCYREYDETSKGDDGLMRDVCFKTAKLCKGVNEFASDESLEFEFEVKANRTIEEFRLNTTIYTLDDIPVGSVSSSKFFSIRAGEEKTIRMIIPRHRLAMGEYKVAFSLGTGNYSTGQRDFHIIDDVFSFRVDRISNMTDGSFAEWHRGWGNIAFEANVIEC